MGQYEDAVASMEEALAEIEGTELTAKQPFAVTDYRTAEWCIAKAKRAEETIDVRKAFVAGRVKQLMEWMEKENARDYATVDRMAEFLEPWVKGQIAGGKKRSISLPSGRAGFRKSGGLLAAVDETALLAHCKASLPDAVKVKETVLISVVNAAFKQTGEVLPGTEVVPERDNFYIDVKEKE